MPVTERLILRDTRMSDVPALFGILGDREAMRHTHCCASLRDCARHVAGHEWQRRSNGHAPWTVLRKADGAVIGWGGLYEDPFDHGWGLEVGYWLSRAAWGHGFASELVEASLAFARGRNIAVVSAFARPETPRHATCSRRRAFAGSVMSKASLAISIAASSRDQARYPSNTEETTDARSLVRCTM